ncbi:hypothetical protein N9242_00875 [Vicingaceae bacterium]|nr:hypothetical protein [Vicingaceae bacterium]
MTSLLNNIKDVPVVANENIRGLITIDVLDAETLEIKRSIKAENTFNVTASNDMRVSGSFTSNYINIGSLKYASEPNVNTYVIRGDLARSSSNIYGWTWTNGTPDYYETKQRFNVPGSDRIIQTIYLATSSAAAIRTYVSLDTPCTQSTTEILDITYRVLFYYEDTQQVGQTINPLYGKLFMLDWFRGLATPIDDHAYHWSPHNIEILKKYRSLSTENTTAGAGYVRTIYNYNGLNYLFRINSSNTQTGNGGQLISTINYGHTNYGYYANAPVLPSDSSRKPIQPIRDHSAGAIIPFLDVNFLAGGTGSIVVNGDNWDNSNWPKYFRIDIHADGVINDSTYTISKRVCVGFENGESWRSTINAFTTYRQKENEFTTVADIPIGKDYGISNKTQQEGVGDKAIVSWDDDGILLQNQTDGDYRVFDSIQHPSFPGINTIQITSIGTTLYVASKTEGIWKIEDVWNTPVFTKFTVAANGVPHEFLCYGVCQGYGNRVWAVFEGGLGWTEDEGLSWTTINPTTSPSFIFPQITDPGNWSTSKGIQVDRDAPDHQLAIVRDNSDWYYPCWYTPANGGQALGTTVAIDRAVNNFRCSYRGGVWVGRKDVIKTRHYTYMFKFMQAGSYREHSFSATGHPVTIDHDGTVVPASYVYDHYGVPLYYASYGSTGTWHTNASFHVFYYGSGQATSEIYNTNLNAVIEGFEQNPPGIYGIHHHTEGENLTRYITPSSNSGHVVGASLSWNHEHSSFQEMVWRRYRYNGNDWILDYNKHAIDTGIVSNGQLHGNRRNFDTESHFFTGRSLIDVSNSFATNTYSDEFTIAMTVTPSAKIQSSVISSSHKHQEYERTLFEITDNSIDQRMMITWEAADLNMRIHVTPSGQAGVNHIVQVTPVDDVIYRIVVSIKGIDFNVYLDGVLVYTGIFTTALDFSNQAGDLQALIGARDSAWGYNKHSHWPTYFYRGTMENIQLWDIEWDQVDVDNDLVEQVSGDGLISSKPGTNLMTRYELTQSLANTETKRTHTSAQDMTEDLTISFVAGASGLDFINTDYYTFGVADGILKDNAMTWSNYYDLFVMPTNVFFDELLNESGSSFIPSLTTTNMTMRMGMKRYTTSMYAIKGGCNSNSTNEGITSIQRIDSDGWIECSVESTDTYAYFGFETAATNTYNTTMDHMLYFTAGTVHIREDATNVQVDVTGYVEGDKFRIQRVGTVITYYKYVAGVLEQIGTTSTKPSNGGVFARVWFPSSYHSLNNLKINYTTPPYIMYAGNINTNSGCFHDDFVCMNTRGSDHISIFINGLKATILTSINITWESIPIPGPGEVVMVQDTGQLIFNSADQGKTITGAVPIVYWKSPV